MRLVVLDTNVLVSAGIRADGAPGRLMMDWVLEGQVISVTCPSVIAEYREVTGRSKSLRHGFPPQWLEFMILESMKLDEPPAWPIALPDATDAKFLGLARDSGAWLVTGNVRHFPEMARGGVRVIPPAEYLAELEGGKRQIR